MTINNYNPTSPTTPTSDHEHDEDEIVSIEYSGEQHTIDINVSGNRLFYANGILTHNSAVEEIEFDHSHIAGGISKIQTADNVIGIFTSRSMKDRGKYQIQFMKTRSSSGVGHKVDLDFNVDTLRITDGGEAEVESSFAQQRAQASSSLTAGFKRTSMVTDSSSDNNNSSGDGGEEDTEHGPSPSAATPRKSGTWEKPKAKSGWSLEKPQPKTSSAPMMRQMLNSLNPEKD